MQAPASNSKPLEKSCQQLKKFGIARRRFAARGGRPDDLGADLIKLAVAAFLRTFATELRPDIVELIQPAAFEMMLDVSADHARGVLGTESDQLAFLTLGAASIFPGEHLFRDDVRFFADPARE